MTNLTQYFTPGPQGTIALKAGTNFSYKGDHLQVYDDTEIDRWFVGSFSSATYFITVEFDSNQKETLQVLVVARPDHASFTVYGRTSVDDQLITISAEVNSSWLSLRASPSDPAYAGSRISVLATYAETMLPLTRPTAVGIVDPGGGGGGGGGGPTGGNGVYAFSTVGVSGQSDISADTTEDKLNFIAGDGIVLTTVPESNSLRVAALGTGFTSLLVTGQQTIQSTNQAGSLRLVGSGSVSITTNSVTNTVTIGSSIGVLPSLTVSGSSTVNSIIASGAISTDSTLSVGGVSTLTDVIVNGSLTVVGTSTIINSSSLEIADLSITLAKNANTALQANGAGIQINGAGAELKWNNADSALTVNKQLLPEFGNNLNLGSPSKLWANVYAQTLTGAIVSPAQTNITSVGSLDNLNVVGNIVSSANLSAVNITSAGIVNITASSETITDVTSSSSVSYNFNQSAIFYHATSPAVDWTAAFINMPTTANRVLSINIIVPQGSTPYKITACAIDGVVQPILWPGGTAPSGTASKTDIWAFTFLRRNNTWVVLASISSNFG